MPYVVSWVSWTGCTVVIFSKLLLDKCRKWLFQSICCSCIEEKSLCQFFSPLRPQKMSTVNQKTNKKNTPVILGRNHKITQDHKKEITTIRWHLILEQQKLVGKLSICTGNITYQLKNKTKKKSGCMRK